MHEPDVGIDHLSERLNGERPELSAEGLAAVRHRVERRTLRRSSSRSSSALIAGCLGLGLLFSGGGTALAVSGLSGDGTAVSRQYPATPSPPAGQQQPGSSPTVGGTTTDDDGGVAGETASGGDDSQVSGEDADGTAEGTPINPTGQIAATQGPNGQLPFTGLAAIPVLLVGAFLLVAGVTLRRRSGATS